MDRLVIPKQGDLTLLRLLIKWRVTWPRIYPTKINYWVTPTGPLMVKTSESVIKEGILSPKYTCTTICVYDHTGRVMCVRMLILLHGGCSSLYVRSIYDQNMWLLQRYCVISKDCNFCIYHAFIVKTYESPPPPNQEDDGKNMKKGFTGYVCYPLDSNEYRVPLILYFVSKYMNQEGLCMPVVMFSYDSIDIDCPAHIIIIMKYSAVLIIS